MTLSVDIELIRFLAPGVRSYMEQSRVFVGMVLILIFGEVLGLYGLIVGLILNTHGSGG